MFTLELQVTANGRENQYFGRQQLVDNATAPLRITDTLGRSWDVSQTAMASPNWRSSPGIAAPSRGWRYRDDLKKAGYLTRDSRRAC